MVDKTDTSLMSFTGNTDSLIPISNKSHESFTDSFVDTHSSDNTLITMASPDRLNSGIKITNSFNIRA